MPGQMPRLSILRTMDKDRLRQYLINDSTRLFAVLDGVAVPDLPMELYKSGLPHYCLMPGDPDPDLVYVSPHLVFLDPENEFTERVFAEGFGGEWGIFAQSRASMTEMRKHFRSLLSVVDESGRSLLFRYYDPSVLRQFLPSCDAEQLAAFFGRVDALYAESEDAESLFRFHLTASGLNSSELN